MPQSLANVIVHLVFSTKDRRTYFRPEIAAEIHAYLAGIARNVGAEGVRVGGPADHVHLALRLPRTITVAALVEKLKTSSSKWLKTRAPELADFSWQRGYGVFSVGPAEFEALIAYIDRQEEHHRQHPFCDEYRAILRQHGVAFDERFMWD
jgi:REP element-mobilizing transposase RayT